MSSYASWIFVGVVFLVALSARWGHRAANKKGFPGLQALLALGAIGVGFALTYDYVSVQTALACCGALVLIAAIQG